MTLDILSIFAAIALHELAHVLAAVVLKITPSGGFEASLSDISAS
jgi:hypothetical protein